MAAGLCYHLGMKRFIGKNDIILAAALLICCALSLFAFRAGSDGAFVSVSVDGARTAVYSLSQDRTVELEAGGGHNTLVIENGTVRMTEADCPNGDCMGFAPISREGQIIVCLPHRLVVRVEGGGDYDVVAW